MDKITLSCKEVVSVYSGKPGCCCGCRGKHTYANRVASEASQSRGYKVNANDVVVKRIVNTMKTILGEGNFKEVNDNENHFSIVTENRLYVAYFQL